MESDDDRFIRIQNLLERIRGSGVYAQAQLEGWHGEIVRFVKEEGRSPLPSEIDRMRKRAA